MPAERRFCRAAAAVVRDSTMARSALPSFVEFPKWPTYDRTVQLDPTKLEAIAERYQLDLVVLFGSAAKQSMHPHSDVDVAVRSTRGDLSPADRAALESELAGALGRGPVDLSVLVHPDPLFLKQVAEDARLLYGSERDLAELRMLAYRRYQDHRHYLKLERRYIDQFLSHVR